MAIGEILGGISAVVGIGSSIFGASNNSKNERDARRAAKEQEKQQRKEIARQKEYAQDKADRINEFNEEQFANEKDNFLANRQFNYTQALRQYDYAVKRQNIEYDTQIRAYNKDRQNLANQLQFNKIAERQAYMREQNVMRDITNEQTFERQEAYIEGMKNRASATLSPAGASGDRAVQMALAEKGRQLAIMDASYAGAIRESNINMFDIALNKMGADMSARAQTMLEPKKPLDLVKPEMTPLPKFTEPMEVVPDYVSEFVPSTFIPTSDTFGSVLSGISSAAGSLSSIDFTNPNQFTPAPQTKYSSPLPKISDASNMFNGSSPFFGYQSNPFR